MKPIIIQAISLFFATNLFAQSGVWSTTSGGNGHYYELITTPQSITWTFARDAAISSGGFLATVTSGAENAFIESFIAGSQYSPWIGGFQATGSAEPSSGWSWVTGESFTYTNWDTNEPNNNFPGHPGANENSLHIQSYNGTWNDLPDATYPANRSYFIEYATPVVSPPPPYTQTNATWANASLLGSSLTIGNNGCFVASAAIILNSYGHHTDPGKLSEFLAPTVANDHGSLVLGKIPTSFTYDKQTALQASESHSTISRFQLGISRAEIASTIGSQIAESGPVLLRVPQYQHGSGELPWECACDRSLEGHRRRDLHS